MRFLSLAVISLVCIVAVSVQASEYYAQPAPTRRSSYKPAAQDVYQGGVKGGYQSAPTKGGYRPPTKSYQPPSKGGYEAPSTKGGYGNKGQQQGLRGLIKPVQPVPTLSKTSVYKKPSKTVHKPEPVEQQKIEQQTQQQEEEPFEQQTQQQEIVQQEEQKIVQQEEQKIEQQPAKGILKWEQSLEQTAAQKKESYVPRKSLLRPQVLEVQQKVQQSQQEPLALKAASEHKITLAVPKLEPQALVVQNVHQVPTFFNADAGWE